MNGYIALVSILIITAVVVLVAISAGLLAISESNMGLTKDLSARAYYLADACIEEALQQINDSIPYSGTGGLTIGSGTCSYTVTSTGGHNRAIEASGTVGTITRKVEATIDSITPSINITSWQEVADF